MTAADAHRVLYRGGSVYTPADPFATALLVEGDTVAWVGSDDAAAGHAAFADVVVELDGALVTPAFVDAHVHVTETGLALSGIDMSGVSGLAEALDAVAAAARDRPGEQVLGTGWDETAWPEHRPPSAAELDRATGGAEVYLSRVDVHSAVVSSALAARGALAGLPGWGGDGRVERDAHHAARRDGEGVLAPGSTATYAVWEGTDLVVQAPDDRFAAWSTDARSGTPGLPDLTPGVPAPRCLRTAVRGRVTHDAPGWAQVAAC